LIGPVVLIALLGGRSDTTWAQVTSAGRGVDVRPVNALPSKERRWALLIGVDNYSKDISPLYGSVNDARALRQALIAYAGCPPDHIILLTSDATDADLIPNRGNILDALDQLSRQVPQNGLLLFSFSGHGVSLGADAFLVPADGRIYQNPELMRERSIDVQRLKQAIVSTGVKQVVMFLDACRNEPLRARGDRPNPLTEAYKRGFSFDTKNHEVDAFATIYATTIGDRAYEFLDRTTQKYRGYFSYAIEEALSGKAAGLTGEVTLGGLIRYVEVAVKQRVSTEKNSRQVPYPVTEGYRNDELVLSLIAAKPSDAFENTILQGEISFNYAVNPSLALGRGDFEIKISWSDFDDRRIYFYSDFNDGIANTKITSLDNIPDATAFDRSSRYRIITLNEVAVVKNKLNYYALVQVLKISQAEHLLSIRYRILPSKLESTWKNNHYSKSNSGKITFDLSNNNHTFTIGENDFSFDTHWSRCSSECIFLLDFPYFGPAQLNIAHVVVVTDALPIINGRDAARYSKVERAISLKKGQRAILKNVKGKYALLTIVDIKASGAIKIDPAAADIDQVVFEYQILPD
jgi:hypothetical protein